MKIPVIPLLTKEEVEDLLKNATEELEVDIEDSLLEWAEEQAKVLGVSRNDYISAIVVKRLTAMIAEESNGTGV